MAKAIELKGLSAQTPLREAAGLWLGARLGELGQHTQAIESTHTVDAVHDARVAARRLRAALHLFAPHARHGAERRVKALQDALGGVRDIQVQLAQLPRPAAAQSEHALLEELDQLLQAELALRGAELMPALDRWRKHDAPRVTRALLQALQRVRGKLGGAEVRAAVARRVAQVERALARAIPALEMASAHRLRIALKKLRYDLELLEPALPNSAARLLEQLGTLQEELGELHDLDVRLDHLWMVRAQQPALAPARTRLEAALLKGRVQRAKELGGALRRPELRHALSGLKRKLRS